jgi:assimilatory nitrate reductase catalytic subunit
METRTTCPYCGVGCGVLVGKKNDQKNDKNTIKGDPHHPANFGRLCSKGSALAETIGLEDRLLYPHIHRQRASWDKALHLVADTFTKTIQQHGPDSVAFYVSGQLLTEDYYAANKLMKGFIGTANIDTNSRLCMASSVAGHRRAFGSDTVPGLYEDVELADLVVLVGSNLAWCHPVLFQRLIAAKAARPSLTIIVIDPRKTMTAKDADIFLGIKPDGDGILFSGLLNWLIENDCINQNFINQHTTGFEETSRQAVFSLSSIALATGLDEDQIKNFYNLFAKTEKVVTLYSQGVNQSICGTDKVNAIINCHLATGRIGRPGMGPFSITGQPNAMGGREVGGLANMLAAHMEIENPQHRAWVQDFWQSPVIAQKQGLKAVDMFKAVADGRIKALWIMGTNPVVSMPGASAVEDAIRHCPFVVVSDVLTHTDTARYAHVKLPAAAWGEKDGTVTNSERCISRQRPFLPLPGEALPDWSIIAQIARHMGFQKGFNWHHPADIFAEFAALSGVHNNGTRDFDISAHADISTQAYNELAPFYWPLRPGDDNNPRRFFGEGSFFTPDKKARFITPAPVHSHPSGSDRCMINTGRVRDHWHTMTRTGKSTTLSQHIAEPYCEIHPEDAAKWGIKTADLVSVSNERGHVLLRASLCAQQQPGHIFIPIHWNDSNAANARICKIITPDHDPISGQPALKMSYANINRFQPNWYGFGISRKKPDLSYDYWASAVIKGGWRFEAASEKIPENWEEAGAAVLGHHEADELVSYTDPKGGDYRFALIRNKKLEGVFYVSNEPVAVARSWASELFGEPTNAEWASILAGKPGNGKIDKGTTICACFSVGFNEIMGAIENGSCLTVEAIGEALKAGTNCGSCRSEIKGMIAKVIAETAT